MSVADLVFFERRTGWAGRFERTLHRRMALAYAGSFAFHLLFLSGFEWTEIFHVDKAEGQPLRARIAPLKPVAAAEPSVKPAAPRARPRPAPRLPKAAEAALPPEPVAAPREPASAVEAPAPPVEALKPEPVKPAPEPALETTAAEAPIAFPESIDLEFNLLKGADGSPVGRVVHRFERQGDRYLIRSTTEASGFGALFASGKFVQESRGMITAKGLRPDRFVVQRGGAERTRTESASFNWESSKATLSAGGNTREWDLRPGAQDLLSFMHQLSFIVGEANPPAVWVTTARRFDTVRIEVIGKVTVETDLGPIGALHFRNHSGDDGLRFEVWLAPDYGNLPVKIRLRDRRGEEAEQVLATMRIR